jgi:methylenetetrahydrofolate dehydrogenase (NADP+)/methenyltetrahydrofolate cyclohydrolase
MHIIDGKKIADEIITDVRRHMEGIEASVITIEVNGNEESHLFGHLKDKAFKKSGINHEIITLDDTNAKNIVTLIDHYNNTPQITGINIQMPLPQHLHYFTLVRTIDDKKDIEGLHPHNLGSTMLGNEQLIPCTPKAILNILAHENITVKGKHVVILNHSIIIGKPLAALLLNRDATVSICHEFTKNVTEYTKHADILVTATGVKWLIKDTYINDDCILIDAGIKNEDGRIYGDAHSSAIQKAKVATPVPGGVGPVTIASMLENVCIAYEKLHKL